MIKLAFFDVDGTLTAPRYIHKDGEISLGFTPEDWLEYCERTRDDGYMDCSPLPCVREFAEKLKREGCRLFVLSCILSEYEPGAKIRFINTHYPDLFEDCFFVHSDPEKMPVIEIMAEKHGCLLSECVLVEDRYDTLLQAYWKGILPVHISNVMAGNLPICQEEI